MRLLLVPILAVMVWLPLANTVCAQDTQELVTEEDLKWMKQNQNAYYRALGATSLSQTETNLLKESMRIQVLQMSLKKSINDLPDIRDSLKRDIDLRAKPPGRSVVLPEIVKNCEKLLNYPLPVKLNAVMLMTELNETSGEITKGIPPAPFQGMVDALLKVINSTEQHEAMKIAAANGLLRLCRDSSPKVDVRLRIAETLVKQLDVAGATTWYKMVCIQAVSRTDVLNDSQRKPFIVQKLAEILVDNTQTWRVRAEAAAGLGRVPMDNTINVPLLTHEVARFTHDLAQQYNKTTAAPHWRYCVLKIYLTFRPEDARDTALLDRVTRAPLSKYRSEIQDVYDVILPVVNDVVQYVPAQPVGASTLADLKAWIDAHPQTNLSVSLDPSVKLKPIRSKAAG